jgi:GH15 family glucan-1,4-alpha-glucosidase
VRDERSGSLPIEAYGLIGDTHTAALVSLDGSVDWLCLPRFDSPACFARLVGSEHNGFFQVAPLALDSGMAPVRTTRRYRGCSTVLDTSFELPEGAVTLTDLMPIRERRPQLVRLVRGLRGRLQMRMRLVIRFDYGRVVPWVRKVGPLTVAVAGPEALSLWTPVATRGEGLTTVADFTVAEGQEVPFVLSWFPSTEEPPRPLDASFAVTDTVRWWEDWAGRAVLPPALPDHWRDAVLRSLVTLKALTYAPTGGIVAAPTTSLPECVGGARNWDYRYCWLRDATLTLGALMRVGFRDEALAWRDWLLRAVAGDPSELQIMYGPGGERRLDEWTVDWLAGYEGSRPVRVGNAASTQFQLDVYGEVIASLYEACRGHGPLTQAAWALERALVEFVERHWRDADEGIWEVRGPRRHFTHSKVMAWVAVDRAVRCIDEFGVPGPKARWRRLADAIRADVLRHGVSSTRNVLTQSYGSEALDASLLMVPMVGFLSPEDPRVRATVDAIEHELAAGGFVRRYLTAGTGVDGIEGEEGAFLACSFWLADALALVGRGADATRLFERLLAVRNDLGLLAEEYDPERRRLLGNFPQAFSHVSLVNAACNLARAAESTRQADGNRSTRRVAAASGRQRRPGPRGEGAYEPVRTRRRGRGTEATVPPEAAESAGGPTEGRAGG